MLYGIWDGTKVLAQLVVPVQMRSNQPVFSSDTLSLKRPTIKRAAQRWELETQLYPLHHTAQELFTFLTLKGTHTPFQVVVPQNVGARLARTATANISATGAVGASSVTIAGTGFTGVIPMGTFIKFANHPKIYMVTADRDGLGVMGIYPQLRVAVPASTQVKYQDDVLMTVKAALENIQGMVYQDGILMDLGTVALIEDL